ncbi:MAG: GGDEF domain-containing protein [Rubrivivax sp.]
MPLRVKLALALLLSSLASIALVGFVAHELMTRRFDDLFAKDALRGFEADVAAYVDTYGSWQAAAATEPFRDFARRRRDAAHRLPALGGPGGADRPPAPPGGAPPRPPGLDRAAYRFLLFDRSGRVLLPLPPFRPGDTVPDELRAEAQPVSAAGGLVGWAVTRREGGPSELDLGYLAAMREALWLGAGGAALLAAVLGLLLGHRLTADLRRLANAIHHVQQGRLGLQAEVHTRDEVGALANAFNGMSAELARHHAALRELSTRDSLTQLHNRRHFDERAGELCRGAAGGTRALCVMLGDVDHFKQINDRFSHAVGDEVLRRVGQVLAQHTRASDIVARYGGEEFVVAFADTTIEHARALADKLRAAIEAHPWHEVHAELRVTISMGVAALQRQDTLGSLLRHADQRLYRAKAAGRNQVCAA